MSYVTSIHKGGVTFKKKIYAYNQSPKLFANPVTDILTSVLKLNINDKQFKFHKVSF